jgi:hypothetical protein
MDIPILICPPENHGGKFENVVWFSSNTDRLSPEQVKRLIREPWSMVQDANPAEIELLKTRIHVRVPKRWAKAYPDAYTPDRPNRLPGTPK